MTWQVPKAGEGSGCRRRAQQPQQETEKRHRHLLTTDLLQRQCRGLPSTWPKEVSPSSLALHPLWSLNPPHVGLLSPPPPP